ncbi:multicopper oxidase [Catellatospora sp. TT07R-123]|uniref:multicopper oxidase family protein n=1 Tax=Catellatospora sp. TT07R-123 TaxID=2733863 RepID=UPI001B2EDA3F|nr:multicopper oxidase [Catellatospora sp. TT07R-123]GHJ44399.1 multicopper oxidase [Catellatospora sp. TT07R-123]
MVVRRRLLQAAAWGTGGALLAPGAGWAQAAARGRAGTLDPTKIRKYATELALPAVMPPVPHRHTQAEYVVQVRQVRQQILPSELPGTTVWAYGSPDHPATFTSPSCTFEALADHPVRVTWSNGLVDGYGDYRPHLLAVDPTLHWANPPGGEHGRDMRPTFTSTPGPYRGPVPIVTHLHGGHSHQESDGYPEAWYLPDAKNIPKGYARYGSFYREFAQRFAAADHEQWRPGSATFQYTNDQRASTLWYHDHTLGMTRLNVYAGLAGFYLLRGGSSDLPPGVLPGPAPTLGERPGTRHYELPICIQDRSFNADGSLFYPTSRAYADDAGPYIPDGPFPPIWNPEFFANTIMANGTTWPVLHAEPRRYRLRLLNGCNARVLILKIGTDPLAPRPVTPALPLWQIGNDGGFLPKPVELQELILAPAERADLIVDFTGLVEGTELYLINEGPDKPFHGTQDPFADPQTTGQVMKFVVGRLHGHDGSTPPDRLRLPHIAPLGPATGTRRVSLDEYAVDDMSVEVLLGTVAADGTVTKRHWDDPVTEHPALGATEIWEIQNDTVGAHPIHLHLVQFEVLGRGPDGTLPPQPNELGGKDTVIAYPGQVTRVKAKFDLAGRYVWHCHLIEHEDNEMMRPLQVG